MCKLFHLYEQILRTRIVLCIKINPIYKQKSTFHELRVLTWIFYCGRQMQQVLCVVHWLIYSATKTLTCNGYNERRPRPPFQPSPDVTISYIPTLHCSISLIDLICIFMLKKNGKSQACDRCLNKMIITSKLP